MSERQPLIEVPSNTELLESILTVEGLFGDSYSRFHAYSMRNIGFLAIQGCPPEPVATFKRWQELGHHVKEGWAGVLDPPNHHYRGEGDEDAEPAPETGHDPPKMMRRLNVVRALFQCTQVAGEGELPPHVAPNWDEARALETLGINEELFAQYD